MNLQAFLKTQGVPFTVRTHPETFDSQHLAQSLHVKGEMVAKAVLLRAEGDTYYVAVLPAPRHVDLQRVSNSLGGCRTELASEMEIAKRCPDCEFGVLPAFGSQYGMKTLVDESLAAQANVVFQGNTHTETVEMKYSDFARLENPVVVSFARHD